MKKRLFLMNYVAACLIFMGVIGCSHWGKNGNSEKKFQGIIHETIDGKIADFIHFETSTDEMDQNANEMMNKAMRDAQTIIDLKKNPEKMTFQNTFLALDAIYDEISETSNRIGFMGYTNNHKDLRDKARQLEVVMNDFVIDLNSRQDLYETLATAEKTLKKKMIYKKLSEENKKFVEETLRDFKRMGLNLPKEGREKAKKLFKKLNELENKANENIAATNNLPIFLTQEEVAGIPDDILKRLEKKDDKYVVKAGIDYQTRMILEYAPQESTRKKIFVESNMRTPQNIEVARDIFNLRAELASILGYSSWSEYQTSVLMVKSSKNAIQFLNETSQRVESKFRQEIALLRNLKVQDTKNNNAKIEIWDIDYYKRIYQEKIFNVDQEKMKNYFTLENTLNGMIHIYEKLFHIKIEYVKAPEVWDDQVQTLAVFDADTHDFQGIIYLDLYPRPEEEKFGHFANVTIRSGMRQANGQYRHPITSLLCNFPKPVGDKPSLLSYQHVSTLFHEFGHALHSVLTKSNLSVFAGTSVVRDFVEAPSQMLEKWVRSKDVLDTFAANYQGKHEKIPRDMVDGVLAIEKSTIALFYRRQLAFAMMDQVLHNQKPGENLDPQVVSYEMFKKYFLEVPKGLLFIMRFGHLFGGYDARYYGYAWSDAIASDMASLFQKSPKGFLDDQLGLKLRREVYEKGSTRDENKSVEKFLGRKSNTKAFVNKLLGKNE